MEKVHAKCNLTARIYALLVKSRDVVYDVVV